MTYFTQLWQTVFGAPISPIEERIMVGVSTRVDRDSSVAVLAAIIVRMLYEIIYLDKVGPFQILRNLAQAAEEHRRMTLLISETYERLQPHLAGLDGTLVRLENALEEARELATAKTGYHPMLGHVPAGQSDGVAHLSVRSIALLCAACCVSAFLGLAICMMIFLG